MARKKGKKMAKVKLENSQRRLVAAKLQERWGLTREEAREQADKLLAAAIESNRQPPKRRPYLAGDRRWSALSALCS